jgi:hypothetical protein
MRRLFWNRSVCRVRRSLKVKTGQSTTSFHPATGNPIMTSSTYNRSVAHATDESKTASSNESPGGTNASKRKGMGLRLLYAINDLLPVRLRPIKSKRAWRKHRYPLRVQLISFRINWKAIHKRNIMTKLGLRK